MAAVMSAKQRTTHFLCALPNGFVEIDQGFALTAAVPEPSTWAMILEFCGLGFMAYRWKNGAVRLA
jgi:hypothetical protein